MIVVASILNWNNFSKTMKCLESLLTMDAPCLVICVTDNHSNDFDTSLLLKIHPKVEIFENKNNDGYAAGHLKALQFSKKIKADFFWILNNDLTVEQDSLKALIHAHKELGTGIFSSASINAQGDLSELDMWQIDEKSHKKTNFRNVPKEKFELNKTNKTVCAANVFGFSMLIPMEVISLHGFMDKNYFLYYEETDYCLRLLNEGIPSYWVGSSKVNHEKQGSIKRNTLLKETIEYYLYRNLFILLRKHGKRIHIIHFIHRFFMRFLSANVARKNRVPRLTKKHLLGILHAFVGIKGKYYRPEDYWINQE